MYAILLISTFVVLCLHSLPVLQVGKWQSWSKLAFIECQCWRTDSFECEFECRCCFNGL